MKIKTVSCEQFAGVRDRIISFEEGINTVYGKNESGKSTLVNLISRTLFQNARINHKSDKEFLNLYFPGANKNSSNTGDCADGKIIFETESGTYTLSKEWGTEHRCTLLAPSGDKLRDQKTIDAMLKEALIYGEGVYSDMLFSSQRNTDISLQTILDASKKTDAKKEIVDVISQAFVESNGISIDAIEQAINTKIKEIEGKHWDFDREMPEREKNQKRWEKERGKILEVYYAMKDAEKVLDDISNLENDVDAASRKYVKSDSDFRDAENAYNNFTNYSQLLVLRSERIGSIARLEAEKEKMTNILSSWPSLAEKLKKAKSLQKEKSNRELLDKYNTVKIVVDEIKKLEDKIENIPCPTDDEIKQAKKKQRDVEKLENKLCGMNLEAAIKLLGDYTIEVKSLRTGEVIDSTNESIPITEAVSITVPDIMEMQLSPANVNVKEIEEKISEQKKKINAILEKYNVRTITELEQLEGEITDIKEQIKGKNDHLSLLLGNTITFEEIESEAKAINGAVRGKKEIETEIIEVCSDSDITSYVVSKGTIIKGYINEYGSVSELESKVEELRGELERAEKSISDAENIPVEFLNIADPEGHGKSLKLDLDNKRGIREGNLLAKTTAVNNLENYKENISDDPAEKMEKTKNDFEEQKKLLAHWKHIEKVFKWQKENLHDNPMQDIADRFTHYLSVITSGKVFSEFPEENKLNINIYSDNHLLDYGKLSEGTKDTVSLAFRLAVLDHLFPEGGGVIIFDDPFTDMDAERTAQSCELIKECAARHQIIFLTCKEEYFDMLGGNKILIEN